MSEKVKKFLGYWGSDGKYWGRNDPTWKEDKPKKAGPKGYKRPTAKQKRLKSFKKKDK